MPSMQNEKDPQNRGCLTSVFNVIMHMELHFCNKEVFVSVIYCFLILRYKHVNVFCSLLSEWYNIFWMKTGLIRIFGISSLINFSTTNE